MSKGYKRPNKYKIIQSVLILSKPDLLGWFEDLQALIKDHPDIVPTNELKYLFNSIYEAPMEASVLYTIVNPSTKTIYGKAIVVETGSEALLVHIEINEKYRRISVGTCLIEGLKEVYTEIVTGADNEEGMKFCQANGFQLEKSPNEKTVQLVWRKDAKEDGEKATIPSEEKGIGGRC